MPPFRLVIIVALVASSCSREPDLPVGVSPLREATLDSDVVPQTLDEALTTLREGLAGKDFNSFLRLDQDAAIEAYFRSHHGRAHRWQTPWPLARESSLRRELENAGFRYPDDMAEAILRAFWRQLHGRPIDLASDAREANARRDEIMRYGQWAVFPAHTAATLVEQCGRQVPSPDGTWTPDDDVIRRFEQALPSALIENHPPTPLDANDFQLSDYNRQYGGLIVDGRTIVYVNGFHRRFIDDGASSPRQLTSWRTKLVAACDGGRYFFGGEYDVQTGHIRIAFN
jgi:hypothetical protein